MSANLSLGNRLLFLGCHLDDLEFGCGALISKYANKDNVSIRLETLSDHNENAENEIQFVRNRDEATTAMNFLGISLKDYHIDNLPGQRFDSNQQIIRERLLKIRENFDPDTVFFPAFHDIHQDHATLSKEAFRIFRGVNCFGYEVIRSSYGFLPQVFVEITEQELIKKTDAIMSYKTQQKESAAYYFNEELVRSIAVFRGGQCGLPFAEAYENYILRLQNK